MGKNQHVVPAGDLWAFAVKATIGSLAYTIHKVKLLTQHVKSRLTSARKSSFTDRTAVFGIATVSETIHFRLETINISETTNRWGGRIRIDSPPSGK